MLVGAGFGEVLGVEPGTVDALRPEMAGRPEDGRIVEARDRQIHVGALLELEAE